MEPDFRHEPTPHDLALAGLVAAINIAASDEHGDDALALELLRVSWPTVRAQNQ